MSGEPADRSDTEPDRWLALPPLGGEWRHIEGLGWQLIQDEPEYVYSDPVDDSAWPRITAPEDEAPDAFPEDWAAAPTERDQAAIDAGNA